MLRTLFVAVISLVGMGYALKGPFEGLLFYLWFSYFRPEYWVWSSDFMLALGLSYYIGWYVLLRSAGRIARTPLDFRALLILLMFAVSGVSAYFGNRPLLPWSDFAKTLTVTYLVYAIASEDIDKFRKVVMVMAFSLGFEAVKQGYAGMILHPGGANMNSVPQLGDNNGVAVGVLMLTTFFLALARTAPTSQERKLHLFLMFGCLYRAVSTYSRGGFLSVIALGSVYILRSNQRMKATIGALVVAGVVLSVLPQEFWDRMSTMNVASTSELDTSSASRLHFWQVAVNMANEHPLIGVGYNAYNSTYDTYDFLQGFYGRRRSVHSMWFGILAELGYSGFIIYVLMLGLAITGMGKVAKQAKRGLLPMEFYHFSVALQTAFAACMVGGSFVPFQYTEMMYHAVGLTMALRVIAKREVAAKAVSAPADAPGHLETQFGAPPVRASA